MHYTIYSESNLNMNSMKPLISSFMPFAKKKMGYDRPVSINFLSDPKNGALPLGKTAYYDPNNFSVALYTDQRHPKDIMRSLSHELVHHTQNCRGDFDKKPEMGEGYFQNDAFMREKEREAYEKGNMVFRDWEETHKKQLQESIYYIKGGNSKMSYKNWRNQEVNDRLMESWGYKAPKTEILSENKEISHLCAMLVTEKTTGRVGHPINHTLLESGDVTHYDVEFDDIVIEGMPVETLNVEVQEEHMHGRREDYPHDEDKPHKQYAEGEYEEELEEGGLGGRKDDPRQKDVARASNTLREEEGAKPDFLDLDKDGDKDESMKQAAEDVEELDEEVTGHKAVSEEMIRQAVREAISRTLNK